MKPIKNEQDMKYYFPETNRTFDTLRGAVNHAIKNYSSMEAAYKDINDIVATPLCPYCVKTRKFKSLSFGYHDTCCSQKCKYKNSEIKNKEIGQRKRDKSVPPSVIDDRMDILRQVYLDGVKYYDFYFGRTLDGEDLHRLIPKDSFFRTKTCVVSGNQYQCDVIRYKRESELLVGPWQGIRVYRDYSTDQVMSFVFIRDYSEWDVKNTKEKFYILYNSDTPISFCKILLSNKELNLYRKFLKNELVFIDNKPVYVLLSGKTEKTYLNKFFSLDELFKMYPEAFFKCKSCDKMYERELVAYDFSESKVLFLETNRSDHCCSRDCYFSLLKENKELFYVMPDEERKARSDSMKDKIRKGEFTPNVTNSRCMSRVSLKNGLIHFRSTWEAAFYVAMKNDKLKFEEVRIKYKNPKTNSDHNYLVDFVDHDKKILYEIKPDSEKNDPVVVAKEESAKKWGLLNGYEYVIFGDTWFNENINRDVIDELINVCDIDEDVAYKRLKQFL